MESLCDDLGLNLISPLWGADPASLLHTILGAGYKVMVVGVYADGMGREWLGRIIDPAAIQDLVRLGSDKGVNAAFEGGEAETLVLNCPLFRREVVIESGEIRWQAIRGEYIVSGAHLEDGPA
jgi:uncharacterized protein (TIGR00290 family)